MVCVKCGQELEQGTKFCTKCGFGVRDITHENKLLKIASILFIVYGVFGVISLLTPIVTSRMGSGYDTASGLTLFLNYLNTISCFFLGITGIMFCNDITKAKILKYSVFAYIGFYVIYSIKTTINTIASSKNVMAMIADKGFDVPSRYLLISIATMIIGIIIVFGISVLYFLGVQKNIKTAKQ